MLIKGGIFEIFNLKKSHNVLAEEFSLFFFFVDEYFRIFLIKYLFYNR
jgi:hypothetical protein